MTDAGPASLHPHPEQGRGGTGRDNLAAIRLMAAIAVVYGHSYPLTGGVAPGMLGNPVSTLAVKVFFVISGYLVTESWVRDPHAGRYLARRGLRIFPGLIVLCLLSVVLFGPALTTLPLADYFRDPTTWAYLKNIALEPRYVLPGVFAGNVYPDAVNGSLWTLPVEFSMYLMMPVVLMLPQARHASLIVLAALVVASLWFTRLHVPAVAPVFWGTSLISAAEMAPYFFWGTVYRLWIPRRLLNLQVALLMLCILPVLSLGWTSGEVICLLILPYVVLAFGFARDAVLGFVERIGDISYGAYLYGFLFQQTVAALFETGGGPLVNFVLAIIPTVLFGFLSWRLVEQPALRYKPKGRMVAGSS